MNNKNKRFQWAATEKGWKEGEKVTPFSEMTNSQLKKLYRFAQKQELFYANKSYVFADKAIEIEEEAERREIELKSLDTDFHQNKKALKNV